MEENLKNDQDNQINKEETCLTNIIVNFTKEEDNNDFLKEKQFDVSIQSFKFLSNKEKNIIKMIKESQFSTHSSALRKLIYVLFIGLFFSILEFTGSYFSNSTSVFADATHMLCDTIGYIISILAINLAKKKKNNSLTFGYHRAEILGAVVTILLILGVLTWLIIEAINRLLNPNSFEIKEKIMLISSGCGIFSNIMMAIILHQSGGHKIKHRLSELSTSNIRKSNKKTKLNTTFNSIRKNVNENNNNQNELKTSLLTVIAEENNKQKINSNEKFDLSNKYDEKTINKQGKFYDVNNIEEKKKSKKKLSSSMRFSYDSNFNDDDSQNFNIRAAIINVMGDLIQSLSVFIGAIILYFKPELRQIDPICTCLFTLFVIIPTIPILLESARIFMEATPRDVDITEVENNLRKIHGVTDVHDLHIWVLRTGINALSCHLKSTDVNISLKRATRMINIKYRIFFTTIQVEDCNEKGDLGPILECDFDDV